MKRPTDRRAVKVVETLAAAYPDARLALHFSTPFQLLMALILAAQCTDDKVNQLTAALLFRKYRSPEDILAVPVDELEQDIHPTGFYRNKAKALRQCSEQLIARFGGTVPSTLEELTSLFGVGRKTANILRGNAFGLDAIGVDTHVLRLSQRLGFSTASDPDKVEADLTTCLPQEWWTRSCYLIQAHGRRVCFARKPNCPGCCIRELCPFPDKTAPPPEKPEKKKLRAFARPPAPKPARGSTKAEATGGKQRSRG